MDNAYTCKIFGFQYTMDHAQIHWDPKEQSVVRSRMFSRAIRVLGVPQLPVLQPYLQARLERAFSCEFSRRPIVDGMEYTSSWQ